jgi:hypothetical protein
MKATMGTPAMKPLLVVLLFAFTLAAVAVSSCGGLNCSPCPKGMHASDLSKKCSACVPDTAADPDGGTGDADAASDAPTDAPDDVSSDDATADMSLDGPAEASADVPTEVSLDASPEAAPTCSAFPDIGCFSGAACASTRVDATCVGGAWHCPVGSTSTEHCPPDGGADAPDASVDALTSDAATPDGGADLLANDAAALDGGDALDAGVDASDAQAD